jgi:Rrf2 family protein
MKLSTKGRYGTRILLDVALQNRQEPVSLQDIARRQQIPLPYVKRLIGPLLNGGLLRSSRGVGGGITLAKSPELIKLKEAIQLLEGSISLVQCIDDPSVCNRSDFCATRDIWSKIGEAMNGVLETTTLKDLVELQLRKMQPNAKMYYI